MTIPPSAEPIPFARLGVPEALEAKVAPTAPLAGRMALARGLMPLAPEAQLGCLYLLAMDPDPGVAAAAGRALNELPVKHLLGVISVKTHPKVLEYLAAMRPADKVLDERIGMLRTANDRTAALIARGAARSGLELSEEAGGVGASGGGSAAEGDAGGATLAAAALPASTPRVTPTPPTAARPRLSVCAIAGGAAVVPSSRGMLPARAIPRALPRALPRGAPLAPRGGAPAGLFLGGPPPGARRQFRVRGLPPLANMAPMRNRGNL
jgi:hypothetical protein